MNAPQQPSQPLDLEHYWMPYTNDRASRKLAAHDRLGRRHVPTPRSKAGRCSTAGGAVVRQCRPSGAKIARRCAQVGTLDYAPAFQLGHPAAFEVAARLAKLAPEGLDRVFFTNSGSEAVDTALKIALAYHRVRGEGTRTRLIGRERGYHGVGFGGIRSAACAGNRKVYGCCCPAWTICATPTIRRATPSRAASPRTAPSSPTSWSGIIALHEPQTIAAVIVEPVAGSAGVLVPPQGYLQRLRAICDKHGILLIFDEVITGFGRLGAPFAAEYFGVTPDLITFAKGITNGTVPMGGGDREARAIHDTFIAGRAAASIFPRLHLFRPSAGLRRGAGYAGHLCRGGTADARADARRGVRERPARVQGPAAGDRLPQPRSDRRDRVRAASGRPGRRAKEVFEKSWDRGVFVRPIGDNIAFCPPLIAEKKHLDEMFGVVAEVVGKLI